MNWTLYHAKYQAFELTQRFASKVTSAGFSDADNLDKITASLSDAQVDLNPHQVDAALFALRSPLSQGVILADEVGLGKTIEAGIIISQRWAERKRKILIIAPANLRKQWSQELADKFFLPSIILEKKSFDEAINVRDNPFHQEDKILICSFQFIRSKAGLVSRIGWDLVVIDEAHRLRNVYRKDNKIGNAIKEALYNRPKILLTATPLQNSLLELYGLISLVDDYMFGDLRSFKQQYSRITSDEQFIELKQRIAPICKRTLRSQVKEYVRYTERVCITHGFESADDEHELYMKVSEYLRKPTLYGLPASQRSLMTLILRKLLASSTFAIAETLKGLTKKLETILERHEESPHELTNGIWEQDYEAFQEIGEEWGEDLEEGQDEMDEKQYTPQELEEIRLELAELKEFYALAKSIERNSKGENLVIALNKGFEKMRELGGPEKAVIFTESMRTQQYIKEILEESGFKDKIVLFNGSNNDSESTRIYQYWLEKHKGSDRISGSRSADIRAALTEYFKEDAQILIATEAAAEGINLQFCSMVVNYDMPWNPQRIEQRIGRCHRYGQRFNVVVINFLNERNAADVRVYNLLDEKLKIFNGVFGASDEVLGIIESGVDFEKRIVSIYQNCRTEAEIQAAFDQLQAELKEVIDEQLEKTNQQLLANFDEEVLRKIKSESMKRLSDFEKKFWDFSKFTLSPYAEFIEEHTFVLKSKPPFAPHVHLGKYRFLPHHLSADQFPPDAQLYRFRHPLAQALFDYYREAPVSFAIITFDGSTVLSNHAILGPFLGASGWLQVAFLQIESFETEQCLLFSGMTTEGIVLDEDQCRRLFSLPGISSHSINLPNTEVRIALQQIIENASGEAIRINMERNARLLNDEAQKLEQWAEDKIYAAEFEIKETKKRISELKRALRNSTSPQETLQLQKEMLEASKRQTNLRRQIFEVEDDINKQRDEMIEKLKTQNQIRTESKTLFLVEWQLK